MKLVKDFLVGALLAACVFAVFELALLFVQIRQTAAELPAVVERQIQEQSESIRVAAILVINEQSAQVRKLVASELDKTRALIASELKATRGELATLTSAELDKTRQSLSSIERTADKRLEAIQGDLNGQISGIRAEANAQLSGISGQLDLSLTPFVSLGRQIDQAAPDFLDCSRNGYGNADCFFNRYVGLARGIEQTGEASGRIANDISVLTHEFTKPKPWYKHLADYLKVGIYGAANLLK